MISASTRFLAQPSEIRPTRNGVGGYLLWSTGWIIYAMLLQGCNRADEPRSASCDPLHAYVKPLILAKRTRQIKKPPMPDTATRPTSPGAASLSVFFPVLQRAGQHPPRLRIPLQKCLGTSVWITKSFWWMTAAPTRRHRLRMPSPRSASIISRAPAAGKPALIPRHLPRLPRTV